ncbi:hypothetical protein [Pseudoduganella namucuonensis]|uniref:Molecular chaperone DnaJ n=1 Tax=Pseudoduganella namucuonensis TaxID=1035707 RepID=A0A1I7LVN8_9BURK|nr:hypothetical protein [Pseudoduganella namucuonensis]SFV13640.1 hypothetical protein SAMN05216552_103951 [Pseudoduganella namucuonensis]
MSTPSVKSKAGAARGRQHFLSLLDKLHAARADYAAWEKSAATLRELAATRLGPLSEQFGVYTRQLIMVLDRSHSHRALSEAERKLVAESICMLADGVLRQDEDPEVKQLYNRYSGGDFDREMAQQEERIKKMIRDAHAGAPEPAGEAELARRKEVAALHGKLRAALRALPPSERVDLLLEQADVFYIDDYLEGLQLTEIELEQLSQPGVDYLSEQRLRICNAAIEDYLDDLEFDTVGIQFSLIMQLGLPGREPLTEEAGRHCLRQQQALIQNQLDNIACDVVDFLDINKLKVWLREKQEYKEKHVAFYQ